MAKSKKNLGIQYMFIAVLLFSVMRLSVKLSSDVPFYQLVFFRSVFALVANLVVMKRLSISFLGNNKKVLWLRGMLGTLALMLNFYVIQNISLSSASSLHYLAPIFVAALGGFFLKEKLKWIQYLFFVLAFCGVLVIKKVDTSLSLWFLSIGIIAALFAGGAYVCVRQLSKTEHPLTIVSYFPMVALPISFVPTLYNWHAPSIEEWFWILVMAVSVYFAQIFMTKAYKNDKAANIAIVGYHSIIYAVGLDFFLFGKRFTWTEFIGITLVIGGMFFNGYFAKRNKKRS